MGKKKSKKEKKTKVAPKENEAENTNSVADSNISLNSNAKNSPKVLFYNFVLNLTGTLPGKKRQKEG